MRTATGILLSSAAAVGLVALAPARAAAPVTIEKSLLGVRILQTYRDVLSKLGQPKLVVRAGEKVLMESALDPSGNDLGGVRDISYEGGGGGASGGGPGGPGSGGMMGKGGGGMGPGLMGNGPGTGGPGSGGPPSMGKGGGSMGGGGGSDAGADSTFAETGGYGWLYNDKRHQTAYVFIFNLEGRVLDIIERGRDSGMPTQRGLKLGDNIKKLYEIYGWPDTIQETAPGFTLDYGSKYHAKFAVIKDKIVGIAVVLEESTKVAFFPEGSGGGGGGMGGGMGSGKMRGGAPSMNGNGGGKMGGKMGGGAM